MLLHATNTWFNALIQQPSYDSPARIIEQFAELSEQENPPTESTNSPRIIKHRVDSLLVDGVLADGGRRFT